jgi:oxygen-independent coproporphyrinogen-3 oxidase
MWREDLETITAARDDRVVPDHLSLYGLIVEPGTPMADAVTRGILTPASDDESADFFELAIEYLQEKGWSHYEIANWAGPSGMPSRHNAIYWRNGDYAGIGAGAHGHVRGRRTMNHPAPRRYIDLLREGTSPVSNVETLDSTTSMGETMMLGLRLLNTGVSSHAFAERHGVSLQEQFGGTLERLAGLGLLAVDEEGVVLTDRGALLANSVCAEFL